MLAAYAGHVVDDAVRDNAASGGVASELSAALLDSAAVSAVLASEGASAGPLDSGYLAVRDEAGIAACQGSRYLPVSVAAALEYLRESDGRVAFVGTACQIGTVKRFLRMRHIDEERVLLIGLVCDMTMGRNFVRYMEAAHAQSGERLVRLDYRTKLHFGWPGGMKLIFDSGREEFVGRDERLAVKDTFRVPRCLYCADKLNREADLVVGDCYIGRCEDSRGSSTIVVRTRRGAEALGDAGERLMLQPVSVDEVLASQGVLSRDDRLTAARRLAVTADAVMHNAAAGLSLSGVPASIAHLEHVARLGQATSDPARVQRSLGIERLVRRTGRVSRRGWQLSLIGSLMSLPASEREDRDRNTVLIVGGHFENRGAQAMVFSVADGIRRVRPEARIVLASVLPLSAEATRYRIDYLPWTLEDKLAAAHGDRHTSGVSLRIAQVLDDAFCMVDVSGFRLASVWGVRESLDFCINLLVARCFGVPSFVMPQSFGPFDYPAAARIPMRSAIRRALGSARRVWAREPEGAEALLHFAGVRAELHPDIVLGHGAVEPSNIYCEGDGPRLFAPDPGSVALVPSLRVVERSGASVVAYDAVIDQLLESGKRVVLLAHSAEDHAVCLDLVRLHQGDERVTVFAEPLDAVELENYLARFDFIVSSRYHSIIHAYKRGVPAVMLGWAVKYRRLAEIAGQSPYVVDLSAAEAPMLMTDAVSRMLGRYGVERDAIRGAVSALSSDDLYAAIAEVVAVAR